MSLAYSTAPMKETAPDPISAAEEFAREFTAVDRALRRERATVAAPALERRLAEAFARLSTALAEAAARGTATPDAVRRCREIVGSCLFRSPLWSRAYFKPHGYAGDFVTIEALYDIEDDRAPEASIQPAIVGCLDRLMRQVHSVVALWFRRRWLADLLRVEHQRRAGKWRVLDIAAGGARYLRDFLGGIQPGADLQITVLDADPTAVSFCRTRSLAEWPGNVRVECAPMQQLPAAIGGNKFDLIISSGLFDYLDEAAAHGLVARLAASLAPGGQIVITNFHPADPSRFIKEWLVEWPLVYRTEEQCVALFPQGFDVSTVRSPDCSLVCIKATLNGERFE